MDTLRFAVMVTFLDDTIAKDVKPAQASHLLPIGDQATPLDMRRVARSSNCSPGSWVWEFPGARSCFPVVRETRSERGGIRCGERQTHLFLPRFPLSNDHALAGSQRFTNYGPLFESGVHSNYNSALDGSFVKKKQATPCFIDLISTSIPSFPGCSQQPRGVNRRGERAGMSGIAITDHDTCDDAHRYLYRKRA